MILCPFCGHENIEGVDSCESCHHSLTHHHIKVPVTKVERSLLRDSIDALEHTEPVSVSPDTPVGDVLKLLVEKGTGCALVVNENELVGVFTERDALNRLNVNFAKLSDQQVSKFMTPNPQTLLGRNKVVFAVQRMDLGGYRHVPVVTEDGQPHGILSVRGILKYLTEKMGS